MAAIRRSVLRSLSSSVKPSHGLQYSRPYNFEVDVRTSLACLNCNYHTRESAGTGNYLKNGFGMMGMEYLVRNQCYGTKSVSSLLPAVSNSYARKNGSLIATSPLLNYQSYSSSIGRQGDNPRSTEVPGASGSSEPVISESGGVGGSGWVDKMKDAWQSAVETITYTEDKAKEASTQLIPYVHQLLDAHPYLRDVIVPVSGTLVATLLAWMVLPRIFRRFHKYSLQGPAALLSGTMLWGPVPYEKSFWGALENPVRYLITFMAFSEIGRMVAPTTISSEYIVPAWRGALIVSFVWFLHRWKTNVFARALAANDVSGAEWGKLLTLDKMSSIGLFVLGLMALAESCGVAVQSVLTVGGIGGVATAFAARDILGNILSGMSVQISQPFSIGDTIKAGSVEGQVVDIGLTTTSLLSAEKFPIIVPNSMFSSQVIVNKSRAQWRATSTKIPFRIDDLYKIPQISDDIKSMLRLNPKVFLEKEPPYCFLSRIERCYAELTVGCNLKQMGKDELFSTEQDILLQSIQILKKHGAALGSTLEDMTSQ